MNKIYGLNIDALRLCYEVTEPNNINVIKDKEIGEEIDFLYFYLRRIEGKHFKFVYEIRYNDMGKINCLENYVWASMTIKKKAIPTKTDIKSMD